MDSYDVIIIGTGAGGGTLARHLAPSGKRILLLERGDWLPRGPHNWASQDVFVDHRSGPPRTPSAACLPRGPHNWSSQDVFVDNRYVSPDTWYDADGKPFQPGVHYCVGGAT